METWKAIPGYEGLYEMSTCGKVKSLNYHKTGKTQELKQGKGRKGYLGVALVKDGKKKNFRVHQLMGITFLGHIPNGMKTVVDHIDNNNRTDNSLENLQIITNRENISKDKKRDLPTGVYFYPFLKKYVAKININKKLKHLGCYLTPEEASSAYKQALQNL
jgi:hypothetical protein